MSNITLTSGDNSTPEELEHAVGPNWREPFVQPSSGGEPAANEKEAPEPQETEQTAAASETAEKPPESKERPQQRTKAQRAIDKLTAKNYQLAKELEEARKAKPAEQPAASTQPPGPPQLKDFKTPEEWADARDAWKEARAAEAEAQQERQVELDEYNRGVSELQATKDDWEETVANSDIQIREYVSAAIVEMGKAGPEVAYYLAKHPEVCEELNGMKKFSAIAKVHEIAKTLKAPATQSSPPPKARVTPPPPIKTVGAASTRSSAPIDDDSVPVSEFIKIRNKQEAAKRAGR
jgi:hypothetical protein